MPDEDSLRIEQDRDEEDRAYFMRRSAWHERQADAAQDESTRMLHRQFAELYIARSRV